MTENIGIPENYLFAVNFEQLASINAACDQLQL